MPTFDTPAPTTLTIFVLTADIRVRAGTRTDTVVSVGPGHPADAEDVEAAERTRVELVDGRIEVRAPKSWRRFSPRRTGGALVVDVELPEDSSLEVDASVADVRVDGRVGACHLSASTGTFTLDETGPLRASTYGEVTVERVVGTVEVTGGRTIRIGRVEGDAEVRNQNGDIRIGTVTGSLRARNANGAVAVDVAGHAVEARTANGDLRVDAVVEGTVDLSTAHGSIDVGITHGTAAELDIHTRYGRTHHDLESTEGPGDATRVAVVRARSSHGDITVSRAAAIVEEQR